MKEGIQKNSFAVVNVRFLPCRVFSYSCSFQSHCGVTTLCTGSHYRRFFRY